LLANLCRIRNARCEHDDAVVRHECRKRLCHHAAAEDHMRLPRQPVAGIQGDKRHGPITQVPLATSCAARLNFEVCRAAKRPRQPRVCARLYGQRVLPHRTAPRDRASKWHVAPPMRGGLHSRRARCRTGDRGLFSRRESERNKGVRLPRGYSATTVRSSSHRYSTAPGSHRHCREH